MDKYYTVNVIGTDSHSTTLKVDESATIAEFITHIGDSIYLLTGKKDFTLKALALGEFTVKEISKEEHDQLTAEILSEQSTDG